MTRNMIRRLAYATLFYAILLTGLLYNAEERYTALWNRHGVDLAEQQVLLFGLGAAFGIGIVVSIFNNINSIDLSPETPAEKAARKLLPPYTLVQRIFDWAFDVSRLAVSVVVFAYSAHGFYPMLRELSDAHMVEVLAEYSLTMVDLPTMSMLYAVVASGLVSYLMAAIFFSVSDIGNARPRPPRAADGVEEGTGTGTAVATG